MIYQSGSDTCEQRCSIIELEDSTIDIEQHDQRGRKCKQQSQMNPSDLSRNQFILSRIQCLQDQKKEMQIQQQLFQESNSQLKSYNANNQQSNFVLLENTYNNEQLSNMNDEQEDKENQNNGNSNQYYYEFSQSQCVKAMLDSQDNAQTEIEKRISIRPEILQSKDEGEIQNQIFKKNNLCNPNLQNRFEKNPSLYSYMMEQQDNSEYSNEQYDYINEQEYEKMMQEIEERETKGRMSTNILENYQLFKPSFHEEILKKNTNCKKASSFFRRNDQPKEEKQVEENKRETINVEKQIIQQNGQVFQDQNEIDQIIFYPQNFSTFNANGVGQKDSSYSRDTQNFSNSNFNQKSQDQNQMIKQNEDSHKINNLGNLQMSNLQNYNSNQSQNEEQNNTFQTTLFQNSFQQLQQQQGLQTDQINFKNVTLENKNYDLPLQSKQIYDTGKFNDKNQRSIEKEKYIPTNINILGVIDLSQKKESSRYLNNDQDEIQEMQQNNQLVKQHLSNEKGQSQASQSNNSGYKPTKFTHFFLGNASSNIVSTDNSASIYSQDQQPTQRNLFNTDKLNTATDKTIAIERNKNIYGINQQGFSNSQERNIQTERNCQIGNTSDRYYYERSIQTERYNNNNKLIQFQYIPNEQNTSADNYNKQIDDQDTTIKPVTSKQPAYSLHQTGSKPLNQAQQLVQKYIQSSFHQSSQQSQRNNPSANQQVDLSDYQINPYNNKQERKNPNNVSSLRQYIEADSSNLFLNKSALNNNEVNNSSNINNMVNDLSKINYSNQNINESFSRISSINQSNNNPNSAKGKKTFRTYFNEISERSNTFYCDKSQRNNQQEEDSINDRASQIISARRFCNSNNNINSSQINNTTQNNNTNNTNNTNNHNITYQLHSTSQFFNEFSQNSPFLEHSFTENLRNGNQNIQQAPNNNKSIQNLIENNQDQLNNKQPLHFNLNIQNQQNDGLTSIQNHQSYIQEQNQFQPQFIQKQYQNVEKKLMQINQSKQTSFHQSQMYQKNQNQEISAQKNVENKSQISLQSNFVEKPYQPIEDRLLQKSKEREIQKQEMQKQYFIQVNEAMKKHKISSKSNILAQKNEQNLSVYDRNQRFLREKEKKQLQLKEEIIQQDILYPYSPNIRPQSQNLVRNVTDLISWKENVNQKTVEMRNKQIVDEIKEIESLQNEKLICKGSEKILQNTSRVTNKQKIEDKLINSGLKYQHHKEELDRIYNQNPTKNIPMINKNTFKLLLNSKKKTNTNNQKQNVQLQNSNLNTQSPQNDVHKRHSHYIPATNTNERSDSTNSKYSKDHSSTKSYYTTSNANSNQIQNQKEPLILNAYSVQSQNLAKSYLNNFSSQQTLSTQQSQNQSHVQSTQTGRQYQSKIQKGHQEEDQDILSEHSTEKAKVLQNQKYSAADLVSISQQKNSTDNKLKIKHLLQQQQKNGQQNKDFESLIKETFAKANGVNQENLNINYFNSPKNINGGQNEQNGTHRYYTNESLKKSFEMRQNYIQQQIQQKSRENSKNSLHNYHGMSNSSSSSNIRSNGKIQAKPKNNQLNVQERNKQWQEQKLIKQNQIMQQIRNEEAAQCTFKPQLRINGQKSNSASRSITPTKQPSTPKDLYLKTKQSYAKQFQMKATKN
ncbi:hypothetical protein TTHERM_00011040 (macronuclear) [Tetrahymena thermophila SB210]|uniref:Uncharacterized protein n=1 Tax=Tetrahymena thermophila (strain SB210) TaxID=312017 RepID=Q22S28_TETTS|nr:hypothetical protein TTHERM_00011040 [Tetrahymena thermophila SB210]EAR87944.2 hypothetical protein TTHERM_00011040 [Tetrahymena thermophila SB210]|eukprot:XP_001008189.2 hypothetical protein TTHERM_00011040 [Tetrahymena thermophila SB210]